MDKNSKDFKDLLSEWNKKLADTGFVDHEDDVGLKHWSNRRFSSIKNGEYFSDKITFFEAKAEYYRMAEWFLNTYTFDNEIHRTIWQAHSEGISVRTIATSNNKDLTKTSIQKSSVNNIISRLAKIMIEKYRVQDE